MLPTDNTAVRLPLLALRGVVVFPKTVASFDVARKKSVNALRVAMDTDQTLFVATQKDVYVEEPEAKDLYEIGTVVRIKQVLKVNDNVIKVLVEGLYRAKRLTFKNGTQYLVADVLAQEEKPLQNRQVYKESLLRRIKQEFNDYAAVLRGIAPDVLMTVENSEDIGFLCDYIAYNIPAPFDDKQYVLEQTSVSKRAKILLELLRKEKEIGEIDRQIQEKTRTSIDEAQKQYYLREQMKVLSQELYGDDSADEIDEYYEKLDKLDAEDSVKQQIAVHISKLAKMPQGSHEGTVERNYLDTCLELPWRVSSPVFTDIIKAEKILNRDIYGMDKVKERIIELLSVFKLSGEVKGQIICLVGPPGVGKTSIGKTIAECMGRSFARISLGGVHDEAEIRGHRKTYIGAMPGKIITAIKQAGTSNPLILLDEIDKLGNDYKGDPSSALLEVLDPEQNATFVDHYVEIPFDLSRTLFVATANTLDTIPAPLRDRMEIIELSSYTREEKWNIAKLHLVNKQLDRHGIKKTQLRFTDNALYGLIDYYTREAGVRKLERSIASLCRKSAKILASGEKARVVIKDTDLEQMLGKHKYKPEEILSCDEVGIINGLAWTQVGGEIMQLEVASMKGTGKVELTGSLGDVMKESARAAISFVRANAEKYGIDPDFYKDCDIHIHATEAAVPKDGPSAGVTITTALISALTNRPVRRDIAMTGEVTIRGRVLPIGGLKEKSMAAYRGGVKTVFIPKANIPDLEEVDNVVKERIEFIPVEFASEIIDKALIPLKSETDNWKMDEKMVVTQSIRPTLR
ncbi:MAG: endopeptidase La [Acutalibacteraceae bacterium]|nr:endopeptidase La [Acutalibacteraceae bacterium]